MRVTDKDRLIALRRLAVKTDGRGDRRLPFGTDQLRYTSAFLDRFSKSVTERRPTNDPSILMVRSMVDEYLLEITAQINWFSKVNGKKTRNYVNEFGLGHWDRNSVVSNSTVQVA